MLRAALRHPVETFITAPFGSLIIGEGVAISAAGAVDSIVTSSVTEAFGSLSGTPFILVGAALVARQLRFRQRIERNIERHGFDERFFEATIDEWCMRQTAYVALQNTEYLDEYTALCDRQSSTAQSA